jgi:hypothetical protein
VGDLFHPDGRGYVLLIAEEDDNDIQPVINAGLTPIIRFDEGAGQAVPVDEDAIQRWVDRFSTYIENHRNVNLFIVGNEPFLEGRITDAQYAQAYVELWREVHLNEDGTRDEEFDDVLLLVAGDAAHVPNVDTWLTRVSNLIIGAGLDGNGQPDGSIDVDGYAIHAYGFGTEYELLNADEIEERNGIQFNAEEDSIYVAPQLRNLAENLALCPSPESPENACDGIGTGWPGNQDGFLSYREQLDNLPTEPIDFRSKPVFITEINTSSWGTGPGGQPFPLSRENYYHYPDAPYTPANNYPTSWIGEAYQDVQAYNALENRSNVSAFIWFVGTPHGEGSFTSEDNPNVRIPTDWRYFALTEDERRLPCARADFEYAAGRGGTPCTDEESFAPNGGAALVWSTRFCTAYPDHIIAWGRDDESGLDRVTVVASPAQTYDLSWTEPGRTYSAIFEAVPPVGGYATFTLYDRAGNLTQRRVFNPGSFRVPGCDHPDENESAASAALPPAGEWTAMPAGTRAQAQVAVFNGGFAGNLLQLLWEVGEPAALVERDFDPVAVAEQYPVLIIPSGGLYGLENSLFFKKRLELYAQAGGTIVAFAQQHGYEFNVLPGAGEPTSVLGAIAGPPDPQSPISNPQSPLAGYGWSEDNSCYSASLLLATEHLALSGFNKTHLTAHVDGYFATYPDTATPLLTRTQNGLPGALAYPWPADGSGGLIATAGAGEVITCPLEISGYNHRNFTIYPNHRGDNATILSSI